MKLKTCLLISLLCLVPAAAMCKYDASKAAAQGLLDVTVYLDVNLLARKHSAAKNLTELHQEFAEHGYRLLAVSPYTENGDLQGFYVSYQKVSDTPAPSR